MTFSWMRFLRSLAIAALFVVGFEWACRRFDRLDPAMAVDPYQGFPGTSRLFQPATAGDGVGIYKTALNKLDRYRAQTFTQEKKSGEFRVFCIGGSGVRSDAFMDPDGSFPQMLFLYLRAAMPDRTVTVLNCGGGGTGSVQNLEVVREIVDYEPDLVVVMPEGGEKNMIPPSPQGVMAKEDDASPLRVEARRLLTKLRLYHGLRDLYRACLAPARPGQAQPSAFGAFVSAIVSRNFSPDVFTRFLEYKVDRPPVLLDWPIPKEEIELAHERFQRNLERIAEISSDAKVPLLFVTPLRNLRSSFYLRFHIRPDEIAAGKIDEWRARYEAGLAAKRERRFEEAIVELERVRALYVTDDDSILAYYLGECHEALGRKDAALVEFEKTYLRHPMRAQIAAVGAKKQVPVVDPYPELLKAASDVIPGFSEFTDSVHPMPKTNRIFARTIYETMRSTRFSSLPSLDDPPMQNADKVVLALCARLKTPPATLMSEAIRVGDYETVVKLAEAIPDKDLLINYGAALSYGWALSRLGRHVEAREFFLKLKARWSGPGFMRVPLATDEEMIEIAYTGDVFHWF